MPSSSVGQQQQQQQQQVQQAGNVHTTNVVVVLLFGIVYSRVWRQLWHYDNDMQPHEKWRPE